MSLLDYFKNKEDSVKIRKNTKIYGVYKEVLYEGEISDMDYYSMLRSFDRDNRKQYAFPCFFLKEEDALKLRNSYTKIRKDGERYIIFNEIYNNIFGDGQSPFKVRSPELYHSYNEFVSKVKTEIKKQL